MNSEPERICLVGVGAIGISFAALHLRYTKAIVSIYDPRPDLEEHIDTVLPGYLNSDATSSTSTDIIKYIVDDDLHISTLKSTGRLRICTSLESACKDATIVQEQGPERAAFKQDIWPQIEGLVSPTTHMWSSTSGIPASTQTQSMKDKSRLLVVHPFNPPHIMPLIEIVPSPATRESEIEFVRCYFTGINSGHYRPVVIRKEVPGFVGNRLAFTLFREACSLVNDGVISVEDLDAVVEASLGPRWAVQGPFKSYNLGNSKGGMAAFLDNLGATMQDVWEDVSTRPISFAASEDKTDGRSWDINVVNQTDRAYGKPDPAQYRIRDDGLRKILEVQRGLRDQGNS